MLETHSALEFIVAVHTGVGNALSKYSLIKQKIPPMQNDTKLRTQFVRVSFQDAIRKRVRAEGTAPVVSHCSQRNIHVTRMS